MSDYNVLRDYYVRYLTEVRKTSESTVNHYLGALRTISKYLVTRNKISETIYEITELSDLEIIREYLYMQPDFVEKDERGNRMYSAGLNNYVRFAKGEDLLGLGESQTRMDIEVSLSDKSKITIEQWRRNGIIKKQSIKMARYLCEMNSKHTTFLSASSGHQYMEGHHAIPMKKQEQFNVSLDVYANIVCLCPICHRLLHYGVNEDKRSVLDKIYDNRADRLANSGIKLSRDEFENAAI